MSDEPQPAESTSDSPPTTGVWPHLRAALVAAHIVAVILLAIPDAAGPAARRSAWKNPTVQNELGAWAHRLSGLGWQVEKDALEEQVWGIATTWTRWMIALRKPFEPYTEYAGVRQRWRMFVAPHRHPARLNVDVKESGRWRTVYVARSAERDWLHWKLDHTRTRSMLFRYAWKEYRRHFRRFASWVARQAFEDFPEATDVRVRWYRYRTPTPEEVRSQSIPAGEFRSPAEFSRESMP